MGCGGEFARAFVRTHLDRCTEQRANCGTAMGHTHASGMHGHSRIRDARGWVLACTHVIQQCERTLGYGTQPGPVALLWLKVGCPGRRNGEGSALLFEASPPRAGSTLALGGRCEGAAPLGLNRWPRLRVLVAHR